MTAATPQSRTAPTFGFYAAPITESPLCARFLTQKTLNAIPPLDWVRACSEHSAGRPDVYVCEAFGGASQTELVALISAIEDEGSCVLMVWTDDWPFPAMPGSRSLVFDVSAPAPRSCSYGWNAERYGPLRIPTWKPFTERGILASFVGSRKTHSAREIVFADPVSNRPDIVVKNVDWWGTSPSSDSSETRSSLETNFAETLSDSKFAFCPRGNGPSSKRRWEAGYCGAIPILIDDFTNPFGVSMPLLEFASDPTRSNDENALELLRFTANSIAEGAVRQEQLRTCLLENFDSSIYSKSHTTVTQIVRIARHAWTASIGFT